MRQTGKSHCRVNYRLSRPHSGINSQTRSQSGKIHLRNRQNWLTCNIPHGDDFFEGARVTLYPTSLIWHGMNRIEGDS